jgi:DNA-binding transcriptional LysR family regulator
MISSNSWFIRARLRTRHLLLLTAIGEEGNIQKAAELLNMSQSAASRQLSDLEDIIGCQLFDRLPRGVRANWFGMTVIRHARNALSSLNEAASEIELLKAGHSGQVTLGAISGPASSFIPRAVAQLAREHPRIRLRLQIDSSENLLKSLLAGEIDVMVGRLLDRHDMSSFQYQRLGDEPLCAVVRTHHPLVNHAARRFHELADQPWIVPPAGSALRHRFELMFREAGVNPPQQLIEAESPMVVVRLMEETGYLALLAREVATYYAGAGLAHILPVFLPCTLDSFGIVTRKDWLLSPAACIACEAIEEAAQVPAATEHTHYSSADAAYP